MLKLYFIIVVLSTIVIGKFKPWSISSKGLPVSLSHITATTNQPLSKWGEVFGDYTLANAIIDRLVHHSQVIKITGQSYRVKGKKLFDDAETAS